MDPFQNCCLAAHDPERDGTKDAEAAVDQTPVERDAAERAGYKGERQNAEAGYQAEGSDPLIAYGITPGTCKGDGYREVGEGEPVGPVGEKGIALPCIGEACVDPLQPSEERGQGAVKVQPEGDVEEGSAFESEWECGNTAEDKPDYENREPEPNRAEEAGSRSHGLEL